jgi:hypothetical protein
MREIKKWPRTLAVVKSLCVARSKRGFSLRFSSLCSILKVLPQLVRRGPVVDRRGWVLVSDERDVAERGCMRVKGGRESRAIREGRRDGETHDGDHG